MNARRLRNTIALAATATAFAACGDEETTSTDPDTGVDAGMEDAGMEDAGMEDAGMEDAGMEDAGMEDAGMVTEVQLAIQLENLEQLGDGYVYEGWLIIAGEPITTGRFSEPVGGAFTVAADDAANADAFVLTIEPEVGDDPAPSAVHVVGGDFDAGVASLSTAHGAALGTDFADVAGTFILETPTSEATEDYANGIWWLDPSAGPGASLTLPALPDGWQYEGWVAGPDGPVSTGTFTATDAADSDGAGPAAGDAGAPSFPGQDFVDPATNLVGLNAVISVEPMPDDSPAPFAIKPLVGPITDAGAGASQTQSANVDALPAGQVSVQ